MFFLLHIKSAHAYKPFYLFRCGSSISTPHSTTREGSSDYGVFIISSICSLSELTSPSSGLCFLSLSLYPSILTTIKKALLLSPLFWLPLLEAPKSFLFDKMYERDDFSHLCSLGVSDWKRVNC